MKTLGLAAGDKANCLYFATKENKWSLLISCATPEEQQQWLKALQAAIELRELNQKSNA